MDFQPGKAGGFLVETKGTPLVLIPLGGKYGKDQHGARRYALIDLVDYPLVKDRVWRAHRARPDQQFHAESGHCNERLHRLLLGLGTRDGRSLQADHKNLLPLDNRRANIRLATPQENKQNQSLRRDNQCGIKGVGKDRGRWRARIRDRSGQLLSLGTFASPDAARQAYDEAARSLHGQFARPNCP